MKIGIITDIHDHVAYLSAALRALVRESVEIIVSLGDASDLHGARNRVDDVAAILQHYRVLGVWGNHDMGLCRDVPPEMQRIFVPTTLQYMATVEPFRQIANCHFSHVEPWLDPHKVEDIWNFFGRPETLDDFQKSFRAVPQRAIFVGHFHRWMAASDEGLLDWQAEAPLVMHADRRYLVVVGPLFRGDYAVLDTTNWVLSPRRVPDSEVPREWGDVD
jgi:predicted phosphodiesterase